MKRAEVNQHHHVQLEALSVRERMSNLLGSLSQDRFNTFQSLFKAEEGRQGVVVTFLAVLELIKESLVVIQQADVYGEIHVKIAAQEALPDGQGDLSGVDDQYE
jgi:segregation and condensation protein A